ncbi:hypothetical protein B0H13DRAFT_1852349 [Mycena leptocephala]|nr:hypothetical protein B0H13DRAFT_1852349 [Mycena leptocephala]
MQLALLRPCVHTLCPTCLTAALNIVDQQSKSLHCVICDATAETFDLVCTPQSLIWGGKFTPFCSALFHSADDDAVVLRIDQVPWDITPPAILTFLGVSSVSRIRRTAIRGSRLLHSPEGHRTTSILGAGPRARYITLTRSSQPALMAALFPFWDNGSLPPRLTEVTLESELKDLLQLIRTPNPPFVKAPSLPFYALRSILVKFPTQRNRQVFPADHNILYDTTRAAIQVLLTRRPEEADVMLVKDFMSAALSCRAFTEEELCGLPRLDTPRENSPMGLDQVGYLES